jgi:4,5-dihydroxyphthalate decarboxylase
MSLRTAIDRYGHTAALWTGEVRPRDLDLDLIEVRPIIAAFRRMIRDLEFDVCELAPTTYVIAREAGLPITAIPVFLTRRFHHGDIICREGSGIRAPKDLERRRVGVRAYSVTTGVWVRGLLSRYYGVDTGSITWMVDDDEHVASLALPGNVVRVQAGDSIAGLFARGEIDAALGGRAGIGRAGSPAVGWDRAATSMAGNYPLFPDADEEQWRLYELTGIYPLHALVCVKQEVIRRHPAAARSLAAAFESAKDLFLRRRGPVHHREIVGPDPLPYGIEANEVSLRALIDFAYEQGLIRRRPAPAELFEPI